MKILIAAAAFVGLAACPIAYATDSHGKPRTDVQEATSQAKARYQGQVQGTKREHRDETPLAGDKAVEGKASPARTK